MKQLFIFAGIFFSSITFAQKKKPDFWQTLDPKKDNVYGVGSEEAYKTLGTKASKTVIVAVIDSGIDPNHEDLKEVIWRNENEIPDNGIDDDKNGYTDDINGWNFLGGKNGDINNEASELARIVQKGNKKFKNVTAASSMTAQELKEYEEFQKLKELYASELKTNEKQLEGIQMFETYLEKVKKQNNGILNKDAFKNYKPENEGEKELSKNLKRAFALGLKEDYLQDQLKEGKEHFEPIVMLSKLDADSIRTYIVGDDVNNPNEKYYGNNHVQGPDARHGTHVAGIIAAMRNNNLGMKGIANNVKIMILRAVPNGDERDKDVANGIRYAVDNGAKIINMSFGKSHSPNKSIVDDAVRYAESKGVLIIHAAGNDNSDNDQLPNYPNANYNNGTVASNWIEVGASDMSGKAAAFSNYGKTTVDLFAPGVEIYSCMPGSKYGNESGTSMAAPVVAGVTALVWSYFPNLTVTQIREVIINSVEANNETTTLPGSSKKIVPFNTLSKTGGIINANKAIENATKMNIN